MRRPPPADDRPRGTTITTLDPPQSLELRRRGRFASALVPAGGDPDQRVGQLLPEPEDRPGVRGHRMCANASRRPARPRASAARRHPGVRVLHPDDHQRLATDRSSTSQPLRHCRSRADENAARHWLARVSRRFSVRFGIVICRAREQSHRGFLAAHPEHAR